MEHLISISDLSSDDIEDILNHADYYARALRVAVGIVTNLTRK